MGGFVHAHVELIVGGDPLILCLEPADALADRVAYFGEVGFEQTFADFCEFLLVFFPETLVDALILRRPLFRPDSILEVDLRKFFDTVDHRQMWELMCRRVQDGVINRLIGKWLKAGVWEKGDVIYPKEGTPQGGVISPLLSNIYLHEVLDKWFVESVQSACQAKTFMLRYADDFVMGFERLEDVHKIQRVIAKRFARSGLKINTEKTRLVRFGRPSRMGEPATNLRPSTSLASPTIGGNQ